MSQMNARNRNALLWIPAAALIILGFLFGLSADRILGFLFIVVGAALLIVYLIIRFRKH